MPDQASVFGSDQSQPPKDTNAAPNGKPADSGDDPLAILVGEGRKYKTPQELAKAYIQADSFIEKLKQENAEAREKLAGAKTVDDVLQRLQQGNASSQDQGADKAPVQGVSAEQVAKIVRDTVTGLETARTRQENMLKADAELKKLYGEKAAEVFAQAANTPEKKAALTQLAQVDPVQFVKLFKQGEGQAAGSQADSGSTVNSGALEDINQSARASDAGCKEYYDALRRKEPRKYYSQEVQLKMNKAAVANPGKFFGK